VIARSCRKEKRLRTGKEKTVKGNGQGRKREVGVTKNSRKSIDFSTMTGGGKGPLIREGKQGGNFGWRHGRGFTTGKWEEARVYQKTGV